MKRLWLIYDLETTGIDTLLDRVVQFAAVSMDGCVRFTSYVNPHPRPMSSRAAQVTGIRTQQLRTAPTFADMWSEFCRHVEAARPEAVRLVGHNSASFDDIMLAAELQRLGLASPFQNVPSLSHCPITCGDTLRAARSAGGKHGLGVPNLKLTTLYEQASGVPLQNAHDALADCEAALKVVQWAPIRRHLELEPWETRCGTLRTRSTKRGLSAKPLSLPAPQTLHRLNATLPAKVLPRRAVVVTKTPCLPSELRCPRCGIIYSLHFDHACTPKLLARHTGDIK